MPFPAGDLPDPGIKPCMSTASAGRFFTTEPPGKPQVINDAQISVAYNNKGLFLAHATWRRKWQPTPVFSPGEFHGQRSLTGYSSWGCKESDTTERLSLMLHVSYGLPMLVASLHQGTHVDRVPSGWTLLDKGKENLINQPGF